MIATESVSTRVTGPADPVADRSTRWGGGAVARDNASDNAVEEERTGVAAHGPLLEALGRDTRLAGTLEALANGEGSDIDAGTLSRKSNSSLFSFHMKR